MALSRRDMLRGSAFGAGVLAVGNVGALLTSSAAFANGRGNDAGHSNPHDATDYGPLVSDPAGILELPEGFSYRIVSRADVQSIMTYGVELRNRHSEILVSAIDGIVENTTFTLERLT